MMKKLEAIGVQVDMLESGQQALDYLARQRPDLIFMDHMMPDMDGFEVTQLIKAAPATRDIPVVIVSGSDDAAFVDQARAIGAVTAITKPPAAGVLESLLAAVTRPPAGVAAAPAPVHKPAEAMAPPAMDRAAVLALVEQVLAGALEPLRDDLLAQAGKQFEAELAGQRQTLQAWREDWREQLEQRTAGLAELRQGAADAKALAQQLNSLEQRLLQLEAEAEQPDFNALRDELTQRLAAGLAELQASSQAPQLQDVRQELLARLDEQQAASELRTADLDRRADDAQAALAQRCAALEQRLASLEQSDSAPALDTQALLAAVDDQIASQLDALRSSFSNQLDERTASLQDAGGLDTQLAPLWEQLEVLRSSFGNQIEERTASLLAAGDLDLQLAPLWEQLEVLRAQLEDQRAQADALEQAHRTLQAELAEQNAAMQARIDAERESLLACQAQEQAQLAASLESQHSQQAAWEQGSERLQAVEQKLAAIDVDAHVQRGLEQRIAQMREVIASALQPDYPARVSVDEPLLPAVPADSGPDLLQDEVDQLKGKVKTLLIGLAVTGTALLVAIGMLVFGG